MKKAVGYVWYPKSHDTNIAQQKRFIGEWCREMFTNQYSLKRFYEDLIATEISERISFNEMLEDAQKKKFSVILVHHHNLFSHNAIELLRIIDLLKKKGISVRFGNLNVDTATPEGRKLLAKLSNFSEYFVSDLARKVEAGIVDFGENSWVGRTPFGFKIIGDKNDKSLRINKKEWKVVEQIFFKRMGLKLTYNEIAIDLDRQGYRTSKQKKFSGTQIMRVFNSPYINHFLEDEDVSKLI
tara:strand:- start:980 stop:1699 length:720 start_codon:yes stop_codon:yes gene_type:complete